MNGAHALLGTLVGAGVDVCFANPGTSEMHFVAALDGVPAMRPVLTLFEGVATGAADGYGRMAGRPAATLLHLGPGLGNGLANLHNARRAHTGIVNVVGEHATGHQKLDAPLQSDIAAVAGSVSGWLRTSASPADVGRDAADAVAAAGAGQVATLVLPADVSWTDGGVVGRSRAGGRAARGGPGGAAGRGRRVAQRRTRGPAARRRRVPGRRPGRGGPHRGGHRRAAARRDVPGPARARRGRRAGRAAGLRGRARPAAARRARATSCCSEPAPPSRSSATPESPATSSPKAASCTRSRCPPAGPPPRPRSSRDLVAPHAVAALATAARPELPTGPLTVASAAAVIGALLPEGAIVVDESNTSGVGLPSATAGAPRHDWLTLTGGAIGYGLPAATGAAVACPDRPVWCLQADGSAMYTIAALWTTPAKGST